MTGPAADPVVEAAGIRTSYVDTGDGPPVLLLHGSGPGVTARANWRLQLAAWAGRFRLLAPDLAGFGASRVPDGVNFGRDLWVRQVVGLLDALGLERVDVVGNSFGGSIALGLATEHPDRVRRLVLMGSVGVPFEITPGLEAVWGYQPSPEAMRSLLRDVFAYDGSLVTDDLVRMRYEASTLPGVHESFSRMFPAPRQRWVDALAHRDEDLRSIPHPTLVVHGREDQVVPLATSLALLDRIPDCRAHVFGRCGHWTQIEHADAFDALVAGFLTADRP